MTLRQLKDITKYYVGEETAKRLTEDFMTYAVNFGIRQVLKDILPIASKYFIKQTRFTASAVSMPSDILYTDNAIVDIIASTDEVRTANIATTSSGYTTFTFIKAGSPAWEVEFVTGGALSVSVSTATNTISVTYNNGVSTNTNLWTALNADLVFRSIFVEATGTDGSGFINAIGSQDIDALSGTMHPAKEQTVQSDNRSVSNTFLTSDSDNIYYTIKKNLAGTTYIDITPKDITVGLLSYLYKPADLSADGDASAIPTEYEELLTACIALKAVTVIKNTAISSVDVYDYNLIYSNLQTQYDNLLVRFGLEPSRLNTEKGKL